MTPPLTAIGADRLAHTLSTTENLLIIQDLDGVCMDLVNDPLTRQIDRGYLYASQAYEGHFFVLTNGEHTGTRGVNRIVEREIGDAETARSQRSYLPGLAAGGVQWQDRDGIVSHPGVSDRELAFLKTVPDRITATLRAYFADRSAALKALNLDPEQIHDAIAAAVLDNIASPTANLNALYHLLNGNTETYAEIQRSMQTLMETLLAEAKQQGLGDSFFIHYAPNLGRDDRGIELVRYATDGDSGTTDFQFMLGGAIKEAGVLALLNRYYRRRTGIAPLGDDFSARTAPRTHEALLALVVDRFDPLQMPTIVGVGDTVTSTVEVVNGQPVARRGGSDRNFLQLVQAIGSQFERENLVVFVDSSQGELKNRQAVTLGYVANQPILISGPGDDRDLDDPLQLDVVLAGGYRQYCEIFAAAARDR
jgi:glucosylglycerol 3-phosphatase